VLESLSATFSRVIARAKEQLKRGGGGGEEEEEEEEDETGQLRLLNSCRSTYCTLKSVIHLSCYGHQELILTICQQKKWRKKMDKQKIS
jgi:hypothetical protein